MLKPQAAYEAHFAHPTTETQNKLWEAIYDFYRRRLRNEDRASDAALLAVNGIGSYDPAIPDTTFEKWLMNIAANIRRDKKRRDRDFPMEEYSLEQLQEQAAPSGIKLNLSAITDPQTRMLAEDVLQGYTIGEASQRCCLTPLAGYKRLARLGKNISRESLIL